MIGINKSYLYKSLLAGGVLLVLACYLKDTCGYCDPDEFLKVLNSEAKGLCYTEKRNGYKVKLLYRPFDYFVAREIKEKNRALSQAERLELEKNYGNGLYFVLNIGPVENLKEDEIASKDLVYSNLGNREKFKVRLQELLFGLPNNLTIINAEQDSLSPSAYFMERGWGFLESNSFMVVFPKMNRGKEIDFETAIFLLKDMGVGIGTMKIPLSHFKKNMKFNIS